MSKKAEIQTRSLYDFKFFCQYFFPEHVKDPFNEMHKDYFKNFNPFEKGIRQIILAPRGSAKTTFICLLDVLHRVAFSTEKYILIMSSTTPLALAKSQDIWDEINENENLKKVFNIKFKDKRPSKAQFTIQSTFGECYIHSRGFFSQVRGIKKRHNRPTLIIGDDTTHGEGVFSEEQREKAKRTFKTDIVLTAQPTTNIKMIGTVIHKEDLVMDLFNNPLYKAKKYKSIKSWPKNMELWKQWEDLIRNRDDPNREKTAKKFYHDNKNKMNEGAEIMWPEREDLLYLFTERINIGTRAFGAEKQMEPFLTEESLFKFKTWFKVQNNQIIIENTNIPIKLNDPRWQTYYALDPATGETRKNPNQKAKKLSCSSRIIAYKDTLSDRIFIYKDYTNRDSPSTIIKEMFALHKKYQFVRMGVEGNLFRDLFFEHIQITKKMVEGEVGHNIEQLPIYAHYQDQRKEDRIYSMEPHLFSGKILLNRALSPPAITQLDDYPNCSNNDFLDAMEILIKIADSKTNLSLMRI